MINNIEDKQFLGYKLLNRGFTDWFKVMFRLIEGRKFIVEPMHNDLFNCWEDIYAGRTTREVINIPPRAGKTVQAQYFIIYCFTKNPKCNFIYTSYSQSLLSDIANKCIQILENLIYKTMYPQQSTYKEERFDPIDDFWKEYLIKETGKNQYSSKKIITHKGGTCLFASMGSQITGYGAAIRNCDDFSGGIIIDDPQKPGDITSQIIRERTIRYYEETLLSRLNNPRAPIICIQQRLHKEDLSGILINKYKFDVIKKPLLDKDGKCTIPTQYTNQRIKELQTNNYMFQAQYQQEPILNGGNIIKKEWFNYYPIEQQFIYKKIVIAADTAIAVKEHSDYSAFIVGGITQQGHLHILDLAHGKWEYPELKEKLVNIYNMWQFDKRTTSCSAVYVENKASGQQLIQELKKKTNLPIFPIDVTKDKLTRVEEILDYIASGQVYLPVNEYYGQNNKILSECSEFSRDMSHSHDDIVDALVHLINNTIAHREVSILEVL